MRARNRNLDWMRKLLADLENSRSDPRIAELMVDLTELSPNIAADVEPNSGIAGLPDGDASAGILRRSGR